MVRWIRYSLFVLLLLAGLLLGVIVQSTSFEQIEISAAANVQSNLDLVASDPPPQRLLILPPGLSIAGVPVGGLTPAQAGAALEQYRLAPLRQPLVVQLGEQSLSLDPDRVGLQADVGEALAEAEAYAEVWPLHLWGIYLSADGLLWEEPLHRDLPMSVELEAQMLNSLVESLALVYDRPMLPLRFSTLLDPTPIYDLGVRVPTWSSSQRLAAFLGPSPGRRLDVAGSLAQLRPALLQWRREAVVLPVVEIPPAPVKLTLLEEVLRELVGEMPGVVGVYVRDLESGREIGVNDTVHFSGASVIKIAILLQAYRVLDAPPRGTVGRDMWAMMVYSDNGAANRLLALGGGGNGTLGARAMTDMLRLLGLDNSFMRNPYPIPEEEKEEEEQQEGSPPEVPPGDQGGGEGGDSGEGGGGDSGEGGGPGGMLLARRAPGRGAPGTQGVVTDADPVLQTTPREMGVLLSYVYACAAGEGPLLELFPGEITTAECQAMLDLMAQNADTERMVAGLPALPVAHKSGWISDMKADAGIVFSPGGDYVLSVFVWEEGWLLDSEANPRISSLSWIVYSFFNPL